MSIILSDVSYHYYNQPALFNGINLSVASGKKVSVIGNNGTGKSTLLKLITKEINHVSGSISCSSQPYYIPQQTDITGISIGHALGVNDKINTLRAISNGTVQQIYYDILDDDWDIESRCHSALDFWGLSYINLKNPVDSLSGGEKNKLFLAGIIIRNPSIILLDKPSNHLDYSGRKKLYDLIRNNKATMIIVSHDIELLNIIDTTYELSPKGLKLYGGNYAFYLEQKETEILALEQQIKSEQTALKLARKKEQEVKERQEKRSKQGEKNKDQLPRIMQKGFKDRGERTLSRLKEKHTVIIDHNKQKLNELKQMQPLTCMLKINFENAQLHNGKLLVAAKKINFGYTQEKQLWDTPVDLEIRSGERLQLSGDNGSGKTTLIKLLTGKLQPASGTITKSDFSYIYLDQEYSQINSSETVLQLALKYNLHNLQDHEVKLRLHRALLPKDMWNKNCNTLSGGEKMRLYLCCLMLSNHIPDLFILDEPTNNLDLSSLTILTKTIKNYRGSLLVISHDRNFIHEIGITKNIGLTFSIHENHFK